MSRVDILSSLNLSASEGVLAEDFPPEDALPDDLLPEDLLFPEDLLPAGLLPLDWLAEDLFLAASSCFADAAGFFGCCWASEVFWAWFWA